MMALCPEAVDMAKLGDNTAWYTATAKDASVRTWREGRRDLIVGAAADNSSRIDGRYFTAPAVMPLIR